MKSIQLINDDYQGRVEVLRHACRGVLVRDANILLGYEKKNDQYIIPGGGVEGNESLEECCERELLQETGMICRVIGHYLDIDELFDVWHHINHYYVCEAVQDTGVVHLTEKEAEAGVTIVWVPLEKALEIFGAYEQYRSVNVARFGLYRREYSAIREYMEQFGE